MNWTTEQSLALYNIRTWSDGYVDINNQGHLLIRPTQSSNDIDLLQLTKRIESEGLTLPVLVRFSDILKHRVNNLIHDFEYAMEKYHYDADYIAVYPIKVNQQRRVIEDIVNCNKDKVGLEAGSKSELLVVIALAHPGSTIICNGYKDVEYIRLALISQLLGFKTYIVIEKLSELKLIEERLGEFDIKPRLGIRIRLSSIARGNWQNTGGEKSKFGLNSSQVLEAIHFLKKNNLTNSLQLIHFHIGSQVSAIEDIESGLKEGTRFYAQLKKLNIPIDTLDIGGGLGIDYEGSSTDRYCSINYSLTNYADTVIKTIKSVCETEKLDEPVIITESGRAMTAHHAMLITNIVDVETSSDLSVNDINHDDHLLIKKLNEILDNCDAINLLEIDKQNQSCMDEARQLFMEGRLGIEVLSSIERLYFSICNKLLSLIDDKDDALTEKLRLKLSDKYFCNFSLFQTMPDSWAIDQIFPVLPLQKLDKQPDRRCTIQDMTCDSDGRINSYIDSGEIQSTLPVHSINEDEEYFIGIFLLGAYQEILGDIHNLFGDSASVNVELDDDNNINLSEIDFGDKVSDLFQTIHIDNEKLRSQYKNLVDQTNYSENDKNIFLQHLLDGLQGYTYLEEN